MSEKKQKKMDGRPCRMPGCSGPALLMLSAHILAQRYKMTPNELLAIYGLKSIPRDDGDDLRD